MRWNVLQELQKCMTPSGSGRVSSIYATAKQKKMILASAIQRVELSRGYQIKIVYSEQIQMLLDTLG
jgi:hypothetical protein